MKSIRALMMAALCASSLSPLGVVAPAMAQSATTTQTMSDTCLADLGGNAAVLLHDGTASFSTEVVETGSVDGPATEVADSRVETPGTRSGTGPATYSNLAISGNPFRTGGSVNMFGDQVATNKNFLTSEYDYTADFATVTTYSYECHVTQQTETYHPAVHIPGHPVLGSYIVNPALIGTPQYNAQLQACNAFNDQAPVEPDYKAPGFWGTSPQGNCVFEQTAPATDPVDEAEEWTLDDPIDRTDLLTSHTVDETNTVPGTGHATDGGPFTETGNFLASKVVICISPSTTLKKGVPGVWRQQNGYLGDKCTTAWFNVAPWGGGSTTSNGTYISVPGT